MEHVHTILHTAAIVAGVFVGLAAGVLALLPFSFLIGKIRKSLTKTTRKSLTKTTPPKE